MTVKISARKITVKGRRGEITKDFGHIPCEIQLMKQNNPKRKGTFIRFRMWFGSKKVACSVRTLRTLVKNMVVGVHEVSIPPPICIVVTARFFLCSNLIIIMSLGLHLQDETCTRSFPHQRKRCQGWLLS